ncbi:type II secretion system protein N [Variovorax guangxiensis]|uniref:Type II secretion system protein N n=1 Tax=Variovorax guangxiensis TaxID=1775474 RepID=A0A502DU63_9BURK|nr:type II secretion system protein N [Variovorax guangxiensis]RZI69329.1 MAG: type II secretion system protein N [Variovorax sp.]TPG24314.1 type II secretion system protein N [Variovorax ginsengisoli]TPG28564.1 type II secretion system protein N [Variovorax guangxiensis]
MAVLPAPHVRSAFGWRWAMVGALLGGLVALTFYAPARWLAAALAQATGDRLQLINARGTVWNGSAGVVFSSGARGAESISLPGTLAWTLRPVWGAVDAALTLPCCAPQPLRLRARPVGGGMELDWRDGSSRWPAALLSGFGAPWNTLKPEGTLDLSTQALRMEFKGRQLGLAGRATLDATDISSSLSTLRPMGSYRITVDGGPTPSLLLTTRDGSLLLSGSGRWSGTAMRFDGEASAAPGREDALSNLLNIIGRRQGARSLITLG